MRPIVKPIIVIAASLAFGVILAGCGGGSSTTNNGSTPGATTTSPADTVGPSTRDQPSSATASTNPSADPPTEFSPPGDIPDDQVFVGYRGPRSPVTISVPEGWARSTQHGVTTFTDKLNSVGISVVDQAHAPTVPSATSTEVPMIASAVSKYAAGDVTSVDRQAGTAVLITYQQDSAPDPVTGKVVRDAVERYEFWRNGTEAILTLAGPVGADNVDPWRIVSDSLSWVN